MVADVLPNHPSEWPAMVAVADKRLTREVAELRRANEISKAVSASFAAGRPRCRRVLCDGQWTVETARVQEADFAVHGAQKVWLQLNRGGQTVADAPFVVLRWARRRDRPDRR